MSPKDKDQAVNLFKVKVDLERLHSQDREYLTWVVQKFGSLVVGVSIRYGGAGNRRELEQACWTHVLGRLDQYNGKKPFAAWLILVAKRHCLSLLRQDKHLTARHSDVDAAAEVRDPGPSPEEHAERAYVKAAVDEALEDLPGKEGEVIRHTLLNHMSNEEAAQEMGVSAATVARLKERGLAKLQRNPVLRRLHQEL